MQLCGLKNTCVVYRGMKDLSLGVSWKTTEAGTNRKHVPTKAALRSQKTFVLNDNENMKQGLILRALRNLLLKRKCRFTKTILSVYFV